MHLPRLTVRSFLVSQSPLSVVSFICSPVYYLFFFLGSPERHENSQGNFFLHCPDKDHLYIDLII